eukprot:CAMPEP_0194348744 /NCGR_PEP_ID=MMETSP0171-20130528/106700_1 /TAXON_ID=218684 /ORGANISM="Corethron pennatum, Strain L29A3" /LENGTH=387 /DNA_ID=CAMNT_0039116107 /DNA_START=131 /DNA_END=1291 /DNA_ORIENTATION=-
MSSQSVASVVATPFDEETYGGTSESDETTSRRQGTPPEPSPSPSSPGDILSVDSSMEVPLGENPHLSTIIYDRCKGTTKRQQRRLFEPPPSPSPPEDIDSSNFSMEVEVPLDKHPHPSNTTYKFDENRCKGITKHQQRTLFKPSPSPQEDIISFNYSMVEVSLSKDPHPSTDPLGGVRSSTEIMKRRLFEPPPSPSPPEDIDSSNFSMEVEVPLDKHPHPSNTTYKSDEKRCEGITKRQQRTLFEPSPLPPEDIISFNYSMKEVSLSKDPHPSTDPLGGVRSSTEIMKTQRFLSSMRTEIMKSQLFFSSMRNIPDSQLSKKSAKRGSVQDTVERLSQVSTRSSYSQIAKSIVDSFLTSHLDDEETDMTIGRRLAIRLSQFRWYNSHK